MKIDRKWIIRVCVLLALAGVSAVWFATTPMGYLLFPPKDLYIPLVLEDLDLSSKGAAIDTEFLNKYKGKYDLGIYFNSLIERDSKLNAKFKITIAIDKDVILERTIEQQEFLFWGWEQGKSGVALLVYESPEELPLNKALSLKVEVIALDKEFSEKYGPSKFFIRKMSDL